MFLQMKTTNHRSIPVTFGGLDSAKTPEGRSSQSGNVAFDGTGKAIAQGGGADFQAAKSGPSSAVYGADKLPGQTPQAGGKADLAQDKGGSATFNGAKGPRQ
jgi:hypothetical protein